MKNLTVDDVMTHLVVTVRPGDSVREAASGLLRNRISGAPVVSDGKLVGIVSEADIAQAFVAPAVVNGPPTPVDPLALLIRGSRSGSSDHTLVRDVMTTTVIKITPHESVWKAAALIDRHNVRRLPVVDDDGYVVGVIARADLVRAMAKEVSSSEEPLRALGAN